MSFKDDFRRDMIDSVTIAPMTGNTGMGPIYGAGVAYPCAVKEEVRIIKKKDGEDEVSNLQVYLDGSVIVTESSKLTYGGKAVKILKVSRIKKCGSPYAVVIFT